MKKNRKNQKDERRELFFYAFNFLKNWLQEHPPEKSWSRDQVMSYFWFAANIDLFLVNQDQDVAFKDLYEKWKFWRHQSFEVKTFTIPEKNNQPK